MFIKYVVAVLCHNDVMLNELVGHKFRVVVYCREDLLTEEVTTCTEMLKDQRCEERFVNGKRVLLMHGCGIELYICIAKPPPFPFCPSRVFSHLLLFFHPLRVLWS